MTRIEKIKNMTTGEMADFLQDIYFQMYDDTDFNKIPLIKKWLECEVV